MYMSHCKLAYLLAILFCLLGCQPQKSVSVETEIAQLRQEIQLLKQQTDVIGSQVEEIHKIALGSKQPKHKTLTTQDNISGDGQLAELGSAHASIAIIEFSDYQCPYCKRFIDTTFNQLKQTYIDSGQVKYLVRDFPLSFHAKAKGAAIAANCSFQQGQYWPMRARLFNEMRQLGDDLYQRSAKALALNLELFSACLKDKSVELKVETDVNYGSSIGIRGTPSFLIGLIEDDKLISPKLLVGAQGYNTFAEIINDLLAEQ